MSQPFLDVRGISKSFGGLIAVNDINFRMSRDEIIGLIGPNGAGKTTLLRLHHRDSQARFRNDSVQRQNDYGMQNLGYRQFSALPVPSRTCGRFDACRLSPMLWFPVYLPGL